MDLTIEEFYIVFYKGASEGDLELCKLLSRIPKFLELIGDTEAFTGAAIEGYLHVCKWLLTIPYSIGPYEINEAFKYAAGNGHLHICKWLLSLSKKKYELDPAADNNYVFRTAKKEGRDDICKWLISLPKEYGIDPTAEKIIYIPLILPKLDFKDLLLFLEDYPDDLDKSFYLAIERGHFGICRWLFSIRKEFRIKLFFDEYETYKPLNMAAKHGHLKILIWLSELDYEEEYKKDIFIDSSLYIVPDGLNIAIKYGQLHICEWILKFIGKHEYYISRAKDSIKLYEVHPNVREWVSMLPKSYINIPRPQNRKSFLLAIEKGRLDICIWILKEYKPEPKDGHLAFIEAIKNGHLHICKWLMTLPERFKINPAAYDINAFVTAAKSGHLHICKWLLMTLPDKYIGIDNAEAFVIASKSGHIHICKWLLTIPGILKKVCEVIADKITIYDLPPDWP